MSKNKTLTRRVKRNRYVDYDHESVYEQDITGMSETFIEAIVNTKGAPQVYCTKTIQAGNQFEVEIYPAVTRREAKALEKTGTTTSQANLNDRNARKKIERKINHNFGKGDIWGTLTYREDNLPADIDEAIKVMKNFIRRIKNKRKRDGVESAFKYIYVTELSASGRIHHHFIMDAGLSMDVIDSLWNHGDRNEFRKLDYDLQNGLSGVANYLLKDQKYRGKSKKRWCSSKNLEEPIVKKKHSTFRSSQVKRMARNQNTIEELLGRTYEGYGFKQAEVRYNDYNGHFYIYAKMYELEHTRY